ncbi:MAG: DNA alkylation repair protein [Roseivirga sp.]
MKTLTSKASILPVLTQLTQHAGNGDWDGYWKDLNEQILQHRVKFPILEHVALAMNKMLTRTDEDKLIDQIAAARHISSYPVIGKLIQLRLSEGLKVQYDLAVKHIIQGDEWYACDIINERVFGEGTLQDFDTSLAMMKSMGNHGNIWVERSIGIATHYATKKKLPKAQVEQLLLLMVEHAWKTQYFTKKGIGWAGKTIGKFHPDLIHKHADHLRATKLSRWFITKVNIGLSMAKAEPFQYE